ncbi:MAG: hypothetical protein A3I44_03780 [Candidatus Sungbacteria bacterium RIFCSPLOWO2_02_FULL_51_17]|uniref:TrbC/VIRB2 family protein n=1 Tax=Candidatus Sungbacteria bacterium RIFCSPHIGHO2_02_FULL_51_29 TaxID=1802273 RepID=A0A1G2KPZ7_9BACT|nr:MAG: hypothetical protein A2676_02300 [Candidatus Sungbacteria bacterium RIFCSPHIGHO2_01_FULL_51_22]OHA01488.1 MAG: hypothetical protein A3C16_05585 [Candidatus Sungbacteria bacterium RIFCSPHIGHO2_02_FULL_51_29]OHA06984.1 MAG: hypothetical protein A3B29_00290 [Candidatus Sungbacteria bacterium RIFCSPLOWO2_01_FULL_51_34]OHA11207.1 MAG: hypothetical protein A3I44_03780 [Candidatus Sungbacteria bacterium RIFCSPLOWO2_02_FULL_51_17]
MSAKTKVRVLAVALTLLPLAAFAGNLTGVCQVAQLVSQFVQVFAFIVFVLAIAAILYAGFLFLTAGGNEAKVESARSAFIWGLIGIAVALFASYAIDFIITVVGGVDIRNCTFSAIR